MTLVATAADPIPDGATSEWLTAKDGTRLRVARWVPASPLRGTVLLLNGRKEFIEKYFEAIGDLLARDFAVQRPDGSWDPEANLDRQFGNVYTTALTILALTPPYQILPIYQR